MITPEQAIRDLRSVADEIEKDLNRALIDPKDQAEARAIEAVVRSWLRHMRDWVPPEPIPVSPSIFD